MDRGYDELSVNYSFSKAGNLYLKKLDSSFVHSHTPGKKLQFCLPQVQSESVLYLVGHCISFQTLVTSMIGGIQLQYERLY